MNQHVQAFSCLYKLLLKLCYHFYDLFIPLLEFFVNLKYDFCQNMVFLPWSNRCLLDFSFALLLFAESLLLRYWHQREFASIFAWFQSRCWPWMFDFYLSIISIWFILASCKSSLSSRSSSRSSMPIKTSDGSSVSHEPSL